MPTQKLPKCPRCGFRMLAQLERKRLWCQACGFERTDPEAQTLLADYIRAGGRDFYKKEESPDHPNRPSEQELVFLRQAWEAIKVRDYKTARYICHELVSHNHRLIDAYWMLFLTAEHVQEKARHLASILNFMPDHKQALREMAKLRPLVGDRVKPSFFTATDYREEVLQTVAAKGRLEKCPMCGGQTLYIEGDEVRCVFCNYEPDPKTRSQILKGEAGLRVDMPAGGGYQLLKDELIRRKYGGGKDWQIAKRVLACQNCGAELTLSGSMMSQQCAFCDSQHILYQDSLRSFQEPDGVLPAELDETEALHAYYGHLPERVRRLGVRHEAVGIFLPYWSFKCRVGVEGVGNSGTYELEDILVPVAKNPSPNIIQDINPYDLSQLRPYDQRYLASWSAMLYFTDAIQASLVAKAYAKYAAIMTELGFKFEQGLIARIDKQYQVSGYSLNTNAILMDEMHFRLLLLPIWMITLHLEGGGYYHGVVNAQSAEVIITQRVDSQSRYRTRQERNVPQSPVIKPISPIRPLPPRA